MDDKKPQPCQACGGADFSEGQSCLGLRRICLRCGAVATLPGAPAADSATLAGSATPADSATPAAPGAADASPRRRR